LIQERLENTGKHASEETKKKLHITHSQARPYRKGIKVSEETRKKLSDSHKGLKYPNRRRYTEEQRLQRSLSMTGKKRGKYKNGL
jgi:hypothetical protein